jgi:methionyl-tRNA synthetase
MSFDDFIRTTEDRHKATVQSIFQQWHDAGDTYLGRYEGLYCVRCEAYYTEGDLVDGNCPWHGVPVEVHAEENWFFRLSKYAQPLLEHIATNPDFIVPETRRNEVVGFIEQGLDDVSISRATLQWGIPLPWDESQVSYVWFDALINYVTAAGYSDDPDRFARQWPAWAHLVGKDIIRFHAVYWPAMLMSAGLPLPRQVAVHGHLLVGGAKLSKSSATQILPGELVEAVGVDGYRHHFLRDVSFGPDSNFSWEGMIERYNADLANDLGNLASRVLNLAEKFRGGKVVARADHSRPEEQALVAAAADALASLRWYEEIKTKQALDGAWVLFAAANAFVEATAPWHIDDADRLDEVLNAGLEALRVGAVLISPSMPGAARRLWEKLGLPGQPDDGPLATTGVFGVFPESTVSKGEALFPRIEG